MSVTSETPVIIGVGEIKNPSKKPNDAVEPMQLMLRAIQEALKDCHLGNKSEAELQHSIDSIDVVRTWSWSYADLPGLLGEKLGVFLRHKFYSEHGGNSPAVLLGDAARRIASGNCKVAVVTGGEAMASLVACGAARKMPPPGWTAPAKDDDTIFSPTTRALPQNIGGFHSVGAPIHVYPLYENALRAHKKQSLQDNNRESAELYANFAQVAETHPMAWSYGTQAETADTIGVIGQKNRMICFPYPLLMNAFNNVNLAAACIITSAGFAKTIGISEEHWVYPLGGAGTRDSYDFWERPNYHRSPSISRSLDAAMEVSGLQKNDIDIFDFYSCFPVVPKLACDHLGISLLKPEKPITLLGGLTSFGGAGNNYSMHAIAEMVRRLRDGRQSGKVMNGLVLANGGIATYQHVMCLSSEPRKFGLQYPKHNPLPVFLEDEAVPLIDHNPEGEATIETYTVEFDRSGAPHRGHIVARLTSNGSRFLANHADEVTLKQLASTCIEPIGRSGRVRPDPKTKGRNLFSFDRAEPKL